MIHYHDICCSILLYIVTKSLKEAQDDLIWVQSAIRHSMVCSVILDNTVYMGTVKDSNNTLKCIDMCVMHRQLKKLGKCLNI